jgi:flagellar hook protein FlgE
VLETGGVRLYGRLGDFRFDGRGEMTDGKGRIVLGWPSGTAGSQALAPIRLPLGQKPDDVSIDAAGNIGAVRANGSRIGFGRIALAIFPAPQRLVRASDETLSATRGSGMPRYFRPAEPGVGSLRSHALETGLVDLEADFKRLWMLRRAGEFQVATAKASDACAATALDLVK